MTDLTLEIKLERGQWQSIVSNCDTQDSRTWTGKTVHSPQVSLPVQSLVSHQREPELCHMETMAQMGDKGIDIKNLYFVLIITCLLCQTLITNKMYH